MCNKSIEEIIRLRTSIRTYRNQPLTEEVRKELDGYCKELKGPFGIKTRLKLVDCEDVMKESNIKLGTYGIIKGATTYIVAVAKKGGKDLEEIGYILEKLILYATSLGLGTCWLGGSFNRSSFSRAIDIKENETIIAVTPVGYPADSKRLIDSVMRRVAGSDSRKNWNELFFDGFFGNVLDKQKAGHYAVPLEMVRLAPSASNKQPWRVVVEENKLSFYLQHTKGYSKILPYDIQRVDMGIAMCHFELAVNNAGITGKWQILPQQIEKVPDLCEYSISWIMEG